ncbi:hypothetical protein J1N35_001232 [Gossypium stocksii]|uniref:Uncharacterized protein n=1 Tax=Gossypium stocksii TaxID=47602 RepID=A0A9D3WJR2_9ROSI|nr:hypothetical protein J1N35_001232 [Gossypium stocksii]
MAAISNPLPRSSTLRKRAGYGSVLVLLSRCKRLQLHAFTRQFAPIIRDPMISLGEIKTSEVSLFGNLFILNNVNQDHSIGYNYIWDIRGWDAQEEVNHFSR